jgi:hypothetical protein
MVAMFDSSIKSPLKSKLLFEAARLKVLRFLPEPSTTAAEQPATITQTPTNTETDDHQRSS